MAVKVCLNIPDFPMLLIEMFKEEIAKHVNADIQVGGDNTVFVSFASDDIVKIQCALIICDKFYFGRRGGPTDV